jgi:hypothetical protein
LALLSLYRAADAIDHVATDPTDWVFVILDLHRALNCALVAALSGTAGIGAFDTKLQAKWISHIEEAMTDTQPPPPTNGDTTPPTPPSEHVLSFLQLLDKAQEGTPEIRLELTAEERADLLKLNNFRGDLEHVKPKSWSFDVTDLPQISAATGRVFGHLLRSFEHHLEQEEIEAAATAIAKLAALNG